MKLQLLETQLAEKDIPNVQICQTRADTNTIVNTFLSNQGLAQYRPVTEDTFLCECYVNGNRQIVGLFSFSNDEIRTQFQINGEDEEPRNYHSLILLALDRRLINEAFLSRSFKVMFPLMVVQDEKSEVFWLSYNGLLYSRVTENIAKNHPCYEYQNEADYFAEKIMDLLKFLKEREDRVISAMEKAMTAKP